MKFSISCRESGSDESRDGEGDCRAVETLKFSPRLNELSAMTRRRQTEITTEVVIVVTRKPQGNLFLVVVLSGSFKRLFSDLLTRGKGFTQI
jgi:hypothetical protein